MLRQILRATALGVICVSALPVASANADEGHRIQLAQADPVVVPGGRFRSMVDYLAGTWVWEKPQPRQTMHMRFGRNGLFFFNNFTLGISHYGRYEIGAGGALHLELYRTCTDHGRECRTNTPPRTENDTIHPIRANEFATQKDSWIRLHRE